MTPSRSAISSTERAAAAPASPTDDVEIDLNIAARRVRIGANLLVSLPHEALKFGLFDTPVLDAHLVDGLSVGSRSVLIPLTWASLAGHLLFALVLATVVRWRESKAA